MKNNIIAWVHDHDDRWSFIVFYIGLSVVLSIYLSLFWVMALAFLHFVLEVVRHAMLKVNFGFLRSLWQVKLDIALVLLAVNLSLYTDTMMAALGLGHTARAATALRGAQMATRFTIIQRTLRIVLMTLDDAARVAQALWQAVSGRKPAPAPVTAAGPETVPEAPPADTTPPWQNPGRGDWFSIGFAVLCLGLIILTPVLTAHDIQATLAIIIDEFTP